MIEISPADGVVTLINVFDVEPERQDALVAALAAATEQVMRGRPGFMSASLHKSLDGTAVANYAQWASLDAFQAMFADPSAREHMLAIRELAAGRRQLYRVVSVHEADRGEGA